MSSKKLGLLDYLTTSKQRLSVTNWWESWKSLTIVVGSEACDLDSAVSALVYAYHLSQLEAADSQSLIIPLLNIAEKDFTLKTEVVFALQEQDITQNQLIFLDSICPEELQQKFRKPISLILVDHTCCVGKLSHLQNAELQEVIDHHTSSSVTIQRRPTTAKKWSVKAVGSCATLIGEKLIKHPESGALNGTTAYLLYETILMDTVNFSTDARKATAKDRQIADQLKTLIPIPTPAEEILSRLLDAKADVAALTMAQLLQKDMKIIRSVSDDKEWRLAVCSLPVLVKDCCNNEVAQNEIEQFCADEFLIGIVILGVAVREEIVQRDVLIYAPDSFCRNKIVNALHERRRNSTLHLQSAEEVLHLKSHSFRYFNQTNTTTSRKHILPVLQSILDTMSVTTINQAEQDDDDENESNLDVYPANVVPPNSYASECMFHMMPDPYSSVVGLVNQRVQSLQKTTLRLDRQGSEQDSPVRAGTFDYDNWTRNDPLTPSNTFVEESILSKEVLRVLPTHHVGALQSKMAYLQRKQDNSELICPDEDKSSETGIFEMD